jgi:hypothetical protein
VTTASIIAVAVPFSFKGSVQYTIEMSMSPYAAARLEGSNSSRYVFPTINNNPVCVMSPKVAKESVTTGAITCSFKGSVEVLFADVKESLML